MAKERFKKFLKYTGSKEREYSIIKEFLPNRINNYYEPFFGGGAVFFKLKYDNLIDNKSYCNDLSEPLMMFYNIIKDGEFKDYLVELANCWNEIGIYSITQDSVTTKVIDYLSDDFKACLVSNKEIQDVIDDKFRDFVDKIINDGEYLSKFDFHGYELSTFIINDLSERLRKFRTKTIEDLDVFTIEIIETSLHQSFYMLIRQLYNDWNSDEKKGVFNDYEKASEWYFIRQFCFGGMFRFGAKNKFNIPYGGLSYNKKCFECNIDALYETQTIKIIQDEKTIFTNLDYKEALNVDYQDDDFIFLDPPYDSTFSTYDNNAFGNKEQEELADFLLKLPCKWMLIIKKTELIEELYVGKENINVKEYDKSYTYKAKGTYENNVKHLIITNYDYK